MPPKGKRKATAGAGDAQAPDHTPEKKAKHVPFADRLFGKSPARGADKASKTVIAVVGGDMHITVFTSLPASTNAVRSLMDPHGDEKRAAHKLRMDALEAGSQSSQDTINLS